MHPDIQFTAHRAGKNKMSSGFKNNDLLELLLLYGIQKYVFNININSINDFCSLQLDISVWWVQYQRPQNRFDSSSTGPILKDAAVAPLKLLLVHTCTPWPHLKMSNLLDPVKLNKTRHDPEPRERSELYNSADSQKMKCQQSCSFNTLTMSHPLFSQFLPFVWPQI